MTDITVYTQPFEAEDLSWDLSGDDAYRANETLDVSLFTQATHFPQGYIPSGCILGKVTASGLLGPYDATANDGRQTAVGVLGAATKAVQNNGTLKTKIGVALLQAWGVVRTSRLPFTAGTTGSLDAAGQTALSHIHFVG